MNIITVDEIPPIGNLFNLLAVPGVVFVKAAYRCVLRREADEAGLQHYLKLLSQGCGKQSILLDMMNSREGRRVGQNNALKPVSATLLRDLEQLKRTHGGRFNRWLRDSARSRELNKLRFDLEIALASMADSLGTRITQELQHRAVYPADAASGQIGHASVVEALQAQRRVVSRPASLR